MMMVIFLTYIIFQRPDIASAADGNAAATTEIWLDSTHSIIVDYSIDVTYNYDEGYTGWIEDMEMRDGKLYGPDPNEYFCGSPYDEDSFGIYAKGLLKALEKAAGKDFQFTDESGTPIQELLEKYIDQGMPVVFWACINMRKEIPGPEWKLLDSGESFCWISNEHCMLLVGYDEKKYYFNDPYDNNGVIGYERELVEKRHAAQHSMAIGTVRI